tara:strand:+ start:6376 stop:6627 length:252 start_codon:yes stop_codon:yes gene_type:complete
MADNETLLPGLPVATEPGRPRPSLVRSQTGAAFVSQLLAARANLAPQRQRRRGSSEGAIGAYADGAKVTVKRMPAGYRKTVVA